MTEKRKCKRKITGQTSPGTLYFFSTVPVSQSIKHTDSPPHVATMLSQLPQSGNVSGDHRIQIITCPQLTVDFFNKLWWKQNQYYKKSYNSAPNIISEWGVWWCHTMVTHCKLLSLLCAFLLPIEVCRSFFSPSHLMTVSWLPCVCLCGRVHGCIYVCMHACPLWQCAHCARILYCPV